MKYKILLLIFFATGSTINAQIEKLHNYTHIKVSNEFSFLKKPDQYQTSSLTKFLLKKNGFPVFLETESIPLEYTLDRCSALTARVIDNSSLFTTKNAIEFKDCYGEVVFTTEFGTSKEKEYKKAYYEAIREAYSTIENFKYVYSPKVKEEKVVITTIADNFAKKKEMKTTVETSEVLDLKMLYAQQKDNGFQLVNATPKVVFVLIKTKTKDVFIIKDKNGAFYKKDNYWIAEYYKKGELIEEKYNVKF